MRVPRPGEQPFPEAEKRYITPTPWQIREEFHRLMREELVGPKDGPDEELLTRVEARVSNRYLLGTLAPKNTHAPMEDEMQADDVESTEASEETVDEPPRPAADSMLSTSIGMTFCVDADTDVLRVSFAWAVYRKQHSEHGFKTEKRGDPAMVWKRIPYEASLTFDLSEADEAAPHPDFQSVRFRARSLQVDGGNRMVSVFLENAQDGIEAKDEAWLFQVRMEASHPNGIELLTDETNTHAYDAFCFANRAMYAQRLHALLAIKRRQAESSTTTLADIEATETPRWRLFQLAFILISLPSLTQLNHPERCETADPTTGPTAELLWFSTGGGKTEAYLGLTAYTLALRRLQGQLKAKTARTASRY